MPAPRLLSPLQDPRPPTPELPDQFIEEHVETPSHQEAPLPDTVLGGRKLLWTRARTACFFGCSLVTLIPYTFVYQKLILKYFLNSNMYHHYAWIIQSYLMNPYRYPHTSIHRFHLPFSPARDGPVCWDGCAKLLCLEPHGQRFELSTMTFCWALNVSL